MNEELIKALEAKGFKRWQKNGMDRMYINGGALGLVCWYYKSGNIQAAELDGEKISNSKARVLKNAKTYIDLKRGLIVSDDEVLARKAAELSGLSYEEPGRWDKSIRLNNWARDEEDYSDRRGIRSAAAGDYSASSPWNAPGMSARDFI